MKHLLTLAILLLPATTPAIVTGWEDAESTKTITIAAPLPAKTYYVDADRGSDSYSGTSTRPWRSLVIPTHGILTPGTTVKFHAGQEWNDVLQAQSGVKYTAYSTGAKPVIGSLEIDKTTSNTFTGLSFRSVSVKGVCTTGTLSLSMVPGECK